MNLYEKHLEAIKSAEGFPNTTATLCETISETYAKEQMEAFDVWKEKEGWRTWFSVEEKIVFYYKNSDPPLTFTQLYNLFKNRK